MHVDVLFPSPGKRFKRIIADTLWDDPSSGLLEITLALKLPFQ